MQKEIYSMKKYIIFVTVNERKTKTDNTLQRK